MTTVTGGTERDRSAPPRRFALRGQGLLGAVLVLVVVIVAIGAPLIAPYTPSQQNIPMRLTPPAWAAEGTTRHLLGTDFLGRDVFTWILHGARVTVLVAAATLLLSALIGILLGLLAGYFEGRVGAFISSLVDAQIAFPDLVLAIAVAAILGPSLFNVIMVLTFTNWVIFARLTYGVVLSVKTTDFVQASRASGASHLRIMVRHILPHTLTPNIATGTVRTAQIALAEAGLSFLGVGVPANIPSWGGIISHGRNYLAVAPWITLYAGLALVVFVLGVTLLGDWLRAASDPRQRR